MQTFHRDRYTWLAYFLLAFYGYFINIFGPITPFLKDELALSYTVSSLHFTSFAIGMLLVGLNGSWLINRIGRWRALWLGAFGMAASALILVAGRSAMVTIGASFCMGLIGSLVLVIVNSTLSDQHDALQAIALSEANVIASLVSAAAPLLVGWAIHLTGSWRLAVGVIAFSPVLLRLGFRRAVIPDPTPRSGGSHPARQPLPKLFWVYWVTLVLAVAVEFCMIYWSADYLETSLGLLKVDAAQAVSLFLAAMIIGRLAASRLVQKFSTRQVVTAFIVFASVGFGIFWTAKIAILGLVGLFITGLGVAGLYPLLLSLALGTSKNNTVQASARATLASGTAILALPLALGGVADSIGIRLAYGVVSILLISLCLIMLFTRGKAATSQSG